MSDDQQHINVSIPVPMMDGGISERLSRQGETLAEIRTDLRLLRQELTGVEGQPGRLTLVENDVKSLNHLRGFVYGAWGALVTFGSVVAYLFFK